jgi:uncharacterized protein (TIGR02246 family)
MNTLQQSTFRFTLFLIGIAFLSSCAPIPGDVSDEITEANNRFMVAFNSGDAELLAESYTDAGKLLPPNGDEVVGKEAIQDFWQGSMDMGLSKAELVTVEATGYGNTAIEEGRYTLFVEGDVEVDHGKYIVIWQKEMGQWKLHRDIWNSSHPAPIARAKENDTVWVIWNKIKPGMVDQFEEFNFNILEPAAAEYYPLMRNTVRTLRPLEAEEDGSWTYIYLMDPVASPEGYDMMIPLSAKYGKEQALEYAGMFTDCLKDGKQHWVVTVQTGW